MFSSLLNRFSDERLKRILRDTGLNASASMGSAVFGLVRNALLSRMLGVTDYGRLAIVISAASVTRQILSIRAWEWATVELARALAKRDAAAGDAVQRFTWYLGIFVNGLAGLIILGTAGLMADLWLKDSSVATPLRLYALTLFLGATDEGSAASLRVFGRYRFVAVSTLVAGLIRVLLVIPLFLFQATLESAIIAIAVGQVLPSIWIALEARKALHASLGKARGDTRVFLSQWRTHVKTFATLSATDTVKSVTGDADPLVIGREHGPAAVGPYKCANNLLSGALQLSVTLYMVFYPEMAKAVAARDMRAVKTLIRQLTLIGVGIGAATFVGIAIFAPLVVRLLYGPGFEGAALDLRVMSFQLGVLCVQWANPLFMSLRRPGWTLTMVIAGAVCKLSVLVALVPRYSDLGAAIACAVYPIGIVGMSFFYYRRLRPLIEGTATPPVETAS